MTGFIPDSISSVRAQTPASTGPSIDESSPVLPIAPAELPGEPPQATRGRLLFAQNCAPCHGDDGMGDGPVAADLPGPATALADPENVRDQSPADWFAVTKYGRIEQMMPPWEARMNDREIWQTVYYAWGLHLDEAALAQAETRYAESCAACHGPQGAGDGPDAPVNDAQGSDAPNSLPAFDDPAYAVAYSPAAWDAAWQNTHADIGDEWSEAERFALLEYIRTFAYAPAWQTVAATGITAGGEGIIAGRLSVETPGAALPDAQEVRLESYTDFEPTDTVVTQAATDGSFRFEGLPLDSDVVYLVVTAYDDVQYSSPILTLSTDEPEIETRIELYSRTEDPTGIFIDRVNWVVEPQEDGLLVGQILTFGLSGDRTYTGSGIAGVETPVTVGIYVPPTAQEVRLENGVLGGRYHRQGNLIYDTVPIAPGPATHQIVIRYVVPIDADPMTLRNEYIYPVNRLNLLAADLPQIEVNAPALEAMGVQDFQGADFQIWQGSGLVAGPVPVHFSGFTGAMRAPAQVTLLQPAAIFGMGGVVTLVLLSALVLGWRQGRLRPATENTGLEAQRDYLLQRIARLDDLHAAGALNEHDLNQQRAQLKVQLLDIVRRLNALEGDPEQAPKATPDETAVSSEITQGRPPEK